MHSISSLCVLEGEQSLRRRRHAFIYFPITVLFGPNTLHASHQKANNRLRRRRTSVALFTESATEEMHGLTNITLDTFLFAFVKVMTFKDGKFAMRIFLSAAHLMTCDTFFKMRTCIAHLF